MACVHTSYTGLGVMEWSITTAKIYRNACSNLLSHPLNKIYLSGFDARRAIPRVFGSLVLGGKLAVAAEGKTLFMENSGAEVAACQLAVLTTDAVRGKHFTKRTSSGGREGQEARWEGEQLRTKEASETGKRDREYRRQASIKGRAPYVRSQRTSRQRLFFFKQSSIGAVTSARVNYLPPKNQSATSFSGKHLTL